MLKSIMPALAMLALAGSVLAGEPSVVFDGKNLVVSPDWTPTALGADLIALYDASNPANVATNAGGNVSLWKDTSGNGRNLSNSNGGQQPNYVEGAINGMSALFFSSTFDQLFTNLSASINVTEFTILAIGMGATGDWPNYGNIESTDLTDKVDARQQSNATQGRMVPTITIDGTACSFTSAYTTDAAEYSPMIQAVWYDGLETAGRINGGIVSASNASAPDGATFSVDKIKAGRVSNTPRNYNAEMIVIQTADSSAINKVEGYLAHKWGITLDAAHPYANEAPKSDDLYIVTAP